MKVNEVIVWLLTPKLIEMQKQVCHYYFAKKYLG